MAEEPKATCRLSAGFRDPVVSEGKTTSDKAEQLQVWDIQTGSTVRSLAMNGGLNLKDAALALMADTWLLPVAIDMTRASAAW